MAQCKTFQEINKRSDLYHTDDKNILQLTEILLDEILILRKTNKECAGDLYGYERLVHILSKGQWCQNTQ